MRVITGSAVKRLRPCLNALLTGGVLLVCHHAQAKPSQVTLVDLYAGTGSHGSATCSAALSELRDALDAIGIATARPAVPSIDALRMVLLQMGSQSTGGPRMIVVCGHGAATGNEFFIAPPEASTASGDLSRIGVSADTFARVAGQGGLVALDITPLPGATLTDDLGNHWQQIATNDTKRLAVIDHEADGATLVKHLTEATKGRGDASLSVFLGVEPQPEPAAAPMPDLVASQPPAAPPATPTGAPASPATAAATHQTAPGKATAPHGTNPATPPASAMPGTSPASPANPPAASHTANPPASLTSAPGKAATPPASGNPEAPNAPATPPGTTTQPSTTPTSTGQPSTTQTSPTATPTPDTTTPGATVGATPTPGDTPPAPRPAAPVKRAKPDPATRALQLGLLARGFYHGQVSGIRNPETVQALRHYQNSLGHPANGKLTPDELNELTGN